MNNRKKWLKIRKELVGLGEDFGYLYSDSWKRKDGSIMRRRKFGLWDIKSFGKVVEILIKGYGVENVKWFKDGRMEDSFEFRVYELE